MPKPLGMPKATHTYITYIKTKGNKYNIDLNWEMRPVFVCWFVIARAKSMVMLCNRKGINVCVCIEVSSNKRAQYFNVNLYKTPFKSLAPHTYIQLTLLSVYSHSKFSAALAHKHPTVCLCSKMVRHLIQIILWYKITRTHTLASNYIEMWAACISLSFRYRRKYGRDCLQMANKFCKQTRNCLSPNEMHLPILSTVNSTGSVR